MQSETKLSMGWLLVAVMTVGLAFSRSANAYIDLAPTLTKITADSRNISLVEVTEFDRAAKTVTLKEVRALKGEPTATPVKHEVTATDGAPIPRQILQWAGSGARGVLFGSRTTALVCIGEGWYQVRAGSGGTWRVSAERPDLPLAYYGTITRLTDSIEQLVANKDAILTVVAFGADNEGASFDLALNRQSLPGLVRVQRIRATMSMPSTVAGASANPAYFLGAGSVDEADVPELIKRLGSTDALSRAESASDLRTLGRKASSAAPRLNELLADANTRVRLTAASALLKINPKETRSLEVLSKGLDDKDPAVRRDAASAVGLAGASAGSLADKLAALLKDADEGTRIAALASISLLGRAAETAAPAVTPLLDNPDMIIEAADALGRIGPKAQPALKRLAEMLKSDQPTIQWAAVRAMSQIGGPDAHPAVDYMIQALGKATEVEGYNMMIYLSLLGPVAADAAPTVRNTPIKNPVLPSATLWAMAPDKGFPWQGGFGGRGGRGGGPGGGPGGGGRGGPGGGGMGGGDIFSFVYQSYVRELGDRLRPAASLLAKQIMDGTAGDVPNWGYDILACGPEESLAILTPHLTSQDLLTRERAAVAIGRMGAAAAGAKPQLETAAKNAPTEREQRLIRWSIRQANAE